MSVTIIQRMGSSQLIKTKPLSINEKIVVNDHVPLLEMAGQPLYGWCCHLYITGNYLIILIKIKTSLIPRDLMGLMIITVQRLMMMMITHKNQQ